MPDGRDKRSLPHVGSRWLGAGEGRAHRVTRTTSTPQGEESVQCVRHVDMWEERENAEFHLMMASRDSAAGTGARARRAIFPKDTHLAC